MTQPIIEVLLATYNGARFLREQLDSVLAQQDVDLRILARDDGSRDDTLAILRRYATDHPDTIRVLETEASTGSAKNNFARLLAASTAPYVAFCDQDDAWLPTKLRDSLQAMRSLEQTHGTSKPLLVYTDLRVVDDQLRQLSPSLWASNGLASATRPKLATELAQNVVTGCTALLNRTLAERMLPIPEQVQMHDHWAALIALSCGAAKALADQTVLYRQHSSNVVGAQQDTLSATGKLQRLFSKEGAQARAQQYSFDRAQASALLHHHRHAMTPQAIRTTEAFLKLGEASRLQRLRLILQYGLWRDGLQRKAAAIADLLH